VVVQSVGQPRQLRYPVGASGLDDHLAGCGQREQHRTAVAWIGPPGHQAGRFQLRDQASQSRAQRLVTAVAERHGGLHVAFNNAGIIEAGPLADMDDAAWDRRVAVNLTGVFLAMKHEINCMRASGGGVIVNTASNLGATCGCRSSAPTPPPRPPSAP
jgi:NAD(P)-dependent dehydrogenase (short-subunit alcohol dehydrogenase family)